MSALDCSHCRTIRAAQQEVLDTFGLDSLPQWGQRPDVDSALRKSQLLSLSADDGKCACDCHVPARVAGRRPSGAVA